MKPHTFSERVIRDRKSTFARRFVSLPAAAVILCLGALALPFAAVAAAGQIDSISPSCASVGAEVTITGNGFGAHNVSIAVGGVTAQVVTATGNMATFLVPAGARLGSTTVTATNPGGHTGTIAFRVCDLLMPASWGGEWRVTITFRNATTGSITAVDDITAFIRSDERFGLAVAANRGGCAGSISDTHLEIQCTGQGMIGTCALGSNVQITVDRTDETMTGSGISSTTVTGICGPLVNAVQSVQISGLRLGLNQNPSGPPATLVKSFVPFASLIGGGQ